MSLTYLPISAASDRGTAVNVCPAGEKEEGRSCFPYVPLPLPEIFQEVYAISAGYPPLDKLDMIIKLIDQKWRIQNLIVKAAPWQQGFQSRSLP